MVASVAISGYPCAADIILISFLLSLRLIQQNPTVDIGATTPLRLAINTAQYGRTFQDRTHLIQLNHRLTHGVPEDANVFNLNVRGKRGNIVQVWPTLGVLCFILMAIVLSIRAGSRTRFSNSK